jgi:hypothetical protein
MQTILFVMDTPALDLAWYRAALRECIAYGEHGQETEVNDDGRIVCFNCGNTV